MTFQSLLFLHFGCWLFRTKSTQRFDTACAKVLRNIRARSRTVRKPPRNKRSSVAVDRTNKDKVVVRTALPLGTDYYSTDAMNIICRRSANPQILISYTVVQSKNNLQHEGRDFSLDSEVWQFLQRLLLLRFLSNYQELELPVVWLSRCSPLGVVCIVTPHLDLYRKSPKNYFCYDDFRSCRKS